MISQAPITIGCDPEIFLITAQGIPVSSVGLIGGSKAAPLDIGEGCAIQEDNVAVEFNTPPCSDVESFVSAIQYNLDVLTFRAKEMDLGLSIVPSAIFADDQLNSFAARTFGCEPDYNAWKDGKQNPKPKAENKNLRSAGGHIHVGNIEDLDCIEVIKAMDLFVGVPLLFHDDDKDRRELYGKAGAFRKKSYGVEYRTASNAWIKSPELIRWAWAQTEKAIQFVRDGNKVDDTLGEMIQQCINTSDIELAKKITHILD